MHTVHLPVNVNGETDSTKGENGFIASAVGLMFSVSNPTRRVASEVKIINAFFDSLEWDDATAEPKLVDEVTYGDLMNMADTNNRWTYKGSVTTPPCAQNVYWNVLRTVYPIRSTDL